MVNPPIWQCGPRGLRCRFDHAVPKLRASEGANLDYTRVDGLIPFTCTICSPHTYAIGVASRYHELVTFYACSQDQLHRFLEDDMTTAQLLRFLGYMGAA